MIKMVTLYSTHCPKCVILEKKLQLNNIDFDVVTDVDLMEQKGFMSLPVLEVDGEVMDFSAAINFVNKLGE